jgi:hypothetical protein
MICYVKTHIDDLQQFHVCMHLTVKGSYSIKLSMKLIAVISHDNYYIQFYPPFSELVQ